MRIPIDSIKYTPSEHSPEFVEAIEELKKSIQANGQLHPITVAKGRESEWQLVTGEKRLVAVTTLGWTSIEVTLIELKDELHREELHLQENLVRDNLSWYEAAALRLRLHELRQKEFGKGKSDAGPVKTGWSMRDTAQELKISLGTLAEDITLAKAAMENPQLKKVKDKTTALRLIRETRKRVEQEIESGAPVDFEINVCHLGDSSDILPLLPDNVFDAVITDPPWLEFYRDPSLTKDESTEKVFKELYRVMKYGSFLYAVVGTDDFFIYRDLLPKFKFEVQKMPIVWAKDGVLTHGKRSWEYARDYELIVLAVKGSPALVNSAQQSSVWHHKVVPAVKLTHPHEKPSDLIERMINDCTYEGALILDPFAGSGVVLETAMNMRRRYIGIERDQNFHKQILRRLNGEADRL